MSLPTRYEVVEPASVIRRKWEIKNFVHEPVTWNGTKGFAYVNSDKSRTHWGLMMKSFCYGLGEIGEICCCAVKGLEAVLMGSTR